MWVGRRMVIIYTVYIDDLLSERYIKPYLYLSDSYLEIIRAFPACIDIRLRFE